MSKYIDADKLEKDGWSIQRIRQVSSTEMVYETMRPTDYPAANVVEVRHGRMVIEPDATVMHCNVCGWAYQYYAGLEEEWNYCPNCGAKMERAGK